MFDIVFKCICFCVISYSMQLPANTTWKRMCLHRKRKLVIQRKLHTTCETKRSRNKIIRISCNVFVCFYVYRNSCSYPHKNACVCATHQNSQDTIICLEYERKNRYSTKMHVFSCVLRRAREHGKYRWIISAKKTLENTRLVNKNALSCVKVQLFSRCLCRARKHRK